MATLTAVKKGERESALAAASKSGARTLAGGLNLPEGTFNFHVADKNAFGILNVTSGNGDKWALPIVGGTMEVNGSKVEFLISDKPGDKTLVVADSFFLQIQPNATYKVTIGTSAKGRKVVTDVVPSDGAGNEEED